MLNSRKLLIVAAAAPVALLGAAGAHADVVYNNVGSSQDGADPIFGVGPLAESFTTGNSGALGNVELMLENLSTAYTGNIQVSLLSNNANGPGTSMISLGTLADTAISTAGPALYTFAPIAATLLAANTTYWIELSATGPNAVDWFYSYDQTAKGVANEYAYASEYGVSPTSTYGAYMMEVGVPEPLTITLLVGGLVGLAAMRRRGGFAL